MDKPEKSESPRRQRRRERLIQLLNEVGGPAQLARESGTQKSYISAITGGSRGLGDELAAKLEQTFHKEPGWFDLPVPEGASLEPDPIDLDEHPELERVRKVKLRLQAGVSGFSVEVDEGDGMPIFFRADWLQMRGYKPYNLIAIKVTGQSMEPNLYANDLVVINTADTEPKDGKVFAVNYEGEAVIKRVVRDGGTWWLSSDNPDQRRYPRKECTEGSCIIVGQVIHKQSEQI